LSPRERLKPWVVEALRAHGGAASIVQVCRHIWDHHNDDLKALGDFFYIWQYDVRWAAGALRDDGALKPTKDTKRGVWELA
jgi:hypothetical protein